MRFACDAMLGRLARWLRLSGYDTVYDAGAGDEELIEACKDRVLLTRDAALARRAEKAGVRVLLLESEQLEEQLAQLVREFGVSLRSTPERSLCPLCNSELVQAEPEPGEVPEPVLGREVYACTGCGRLYWEGSHWRSIAERVRRVEQKVRG